MSSSTRQRIPHYEFWNIWANVVYHYPEHPDVQKPGDYQRFFYTLGYFLKTSKLRHKYLHVYSKDWECQINSYLNTKTSMWEWGTIFFNKVVLNKKLGAPKFWSWDKIVNRLGVVTEPSHVHRITLYELESIPLEIPVNVSILSLIQFLKDIINSYPPGDPSNDIMVLYKRLFEDLRFVYHPLISPTKYDLFLAKYPPAPYLRNRHLLTQYSNLYINKLLVK